MTAFTFVHITPPATRAYARNVCLYVCARKTKIYIDADRMCKEDVYSEGAHSGKLISSAASFKEGARSLLSL